MAGGKQKLAAKIKRYKQSLEQKRLEKMGKEGQTSSDCSEHSNGEGCSSGTDQELVSGNQLSEQDLHRLKQEIIRQRQRRRKDLRVGNGFNLNWLYDVGDNFLNLVYGFPMWFMMFFGGFVLTVIAVYFFRFLLLSFMPHAVQIDRSPLYSSLRGYLPGCLYKVLLLLDYTFTSSSLSIEGIKEIMSAPDEKKFQEFLAWRHHQQHRPW